MHRDATTIAASGRWARVWSGVALVVSSVAPVLMAIDPTRAGLWLRVMFVVAMLWLGRRWANPSERSGRA